MQLIRFLLFKVFLYFCCRKEIGTVAAIVNGTTYGIKIVVNIAACLISFTSILATLDGLLSWFGGLLDYPELTFEVINNNF